MEPGVWGCGGVEMGVYVWVPLQPGILSVAMKLFQLRSSVKPSVATPGFPWAVWVGFLVLQGKKLQEGTDKNFALIINQGNGSLLFLRLKMARESFHSLPNWLWKDVNRVWLRLWLARNSWLFCHCKTINWGQRDSSGGMWLSCMCLTPLVCFPAPH